MHAPEKHDAGVLFQEFVSLIPLLHELVSFLAHLHVHPWQVLPYGGHRVWRKVGVRTRDGELPVRSRHFGVGMLVVKAPRAGNGQECLDEPRTRPASALSASRTQASVDKEGGSCGLLLLEQIPDIFEISVDLGKIGVVVLGQKVVLL